MNAMTPPVAPLTGEIAGLAPAMAPFLDPTALAIVVGGTLIALLLRAPLGDLVRAVRALGTLARRSFDAEGCLTQIDALARISARHGIVPLDRAVIADPDVADAIAAIVDGIAPDMLERRLAERIAARDERHAAAIGVWTAAADLAPAMGMVGTLIGLVRMFSAMSDPMAIGGSMAIALLATLYGAIIAFLVASPIAGRLRARARAESIGRARLVPPLVELAGREQPRRVTIATEAA